MRRIKLADRGDSSNSQGRAKPSLDSQKSFGLHSAKAPLAVRPESKCVLGSPISLLGTR